MRRRKKNLIANSAISALTGERGPLRRGPAAARSWRWSLLWLPLFALLTVAATAGNRAAEMIPASDLREAARIASERKLVLVLEFSSATCEYCRRLEALFLLPMQRNPEYEHKILIRSVSIDDAESLIDFDGRSVDAQDFASRYGVDLTPTLVFLGPDGDELSEKLVGLWSEDFYGGFIDHRIDTARSAL